MNLTRVSILIFLVAFSSCGGNHGGSSAPKLETTNPEIAREAGSKIISIPTDLKKFTGPGGNIYYQVLAQGQNLLIVHNRGLSHSTDGGRTFSNDTSLVASSEYATYRAPHAILVRDEQGQVFSVDVFGKKKFLFKGAVKEWNYGQFCTGSEQIVCSDDGFETSYTIPTYDIRDAVWLHRKDQKVQMITSEGLYTLNRVGQRWEFEKRTWPQNILDHFYSFSWFLQIPSGGFYVNTGTWGTGWMKVSEDFTSWDFVELRETPERIVRQGDRELFQFRKDDFHRVLYSNNGSEWTKEFEGSDFSFSDNLDLYIVQKNDYSSFWSKRMDDLYVKRNGSEPVLLERPVSQYFSLASEIYANKSGFLLAETPIGEILSTDGGLTAKVVRDTTKSAKPLKVMGVDDGFILLFPVKSESSPSHDPGAFQVLKLTQAGTTDLKWPHRNFTNEIYDLAEQDGVIFALSTAGFFQLTNDSWLPVFTHEYYYEKGSKFTVRGNEFWITDRRHFWKIDKQGKAIYGLNPYNFEELGKMVDLGELGIYIFGKNNITSYDPVVFYYSIDDGLTWKFFDTREGSDVFAKDKTVYVTGSHWGGFPSFDPYKGGEPYTSYCRNPSLGRCMEGSVGKVVEANGGNYFLNYSERKLQFVKDF